MSHLLVWREFIRRYDGLNDLDYIVIFENDATCAVQQRSRGFVAQNELKHSTSDFVFLGWCDEYRDGAFLKNTVAPMCLHAYAMNLIAAKALSARVFECQSPADMQVRHLLGVEHIVSWSKADMRVVVVNSPNPHRSDGIHTDGIFLQATFRGEKN